MENTNENGQSSQGVDVSKFKQMFESFKQKDKKSQKRPSREQILAKYFVPRHDKEVFRILPPLAGRDYIETAFFHVVPVNAAGGKKRYKKIYCPAHNDAKVPKKDANGNVIRDQQGNPVMVTKTCPLCEKSKAILSKQDPSLRGIKKEDMDKEQLAIKESNDKIYKESLDWQAKRFYIVRGIDKGAEKDGVKFWRFKHNFKQQGVLDKLGPAVTDFMEANGVDFTDPKSGTDLKITVVDADLPGRNRTYRDVSSIYPLGKSPLHADPIVVKEWLGDDTTWRDVFKLSTPPNVEADEYLEMIAMGQSPYWDDTDQNNKKWVFPGRPDLEEKANTRNQNLDAEKKEPMIEMASDVVNKPMDDVTISNVTKEDVGEFQDNSVDLTEEVKKAAVSEEPTEVEEPQKEAETADVSNEDASENYEDYDDLPF
jgi:hypothetical protein